MISLKKRHSYIQAQMRNCETKQYTSLWSYYFEYCLFLLMYFIEYVCY